MSAGPPKPDPLDVTIVDPASQGRPPQTVPPVPEATLLDARTKGGAGPGEFPTLPASAPVGSFTTSLAANSAQRIGVTIPEPFFAAGTPGSLLRLVPVEQLRGKPPLELYLKIGPAFTMGRSPEADLIVCFFPRSEKNDLRSRRLSKIHARIEYHDSQLRAHSVNGSTVHIGGQKISPDPAGASLRELDELVLAEDFALGIYYDISLQGTLQFTNGEAWQAGRIEFNPVQLGAVRFEPLNSAPALRTSCWLFVDVGFGSARGGGVTVGAELAPNQGVFLAIGGCFWLLNLVNNEKVAINEYRPAAQEIVPLTQGDSIWLGAVRYRAEIV